MPQSDGVRHLLVTRSGSQGWPFILFVVLVIALMSCSDSGREKIDRFIAEVKKTPSPMLSPIPTVRPHRKEPYMAQGSPSPFSPMLQNGISPPDAGRLHGLLEAFALDSLKMVGTIANNGRLWALIAVPNGTIYSVTVGDYVGQHDGRIVTVTEKGLQVQETIKAGEAWKKHDVGLTLIEGQPPSPQKK